MFIFFELPQQLAYSPCKYIKTTDYLNHCRRYPGIVSFSQQWSFRFKQPSYFAGSLVSSHLVPSSTAVPVPGCVLSYQCPWPSETERSEHIWCLPSITGALCAGVNGGGAESLLCLDSLRSIDDTSVFLNPKTRHQEV